MFMLSRVRGLIGVAAALALSGVALAVEEPPAQRPSAPTATEAPSTASADTAQNVPESPMQRIQQVLARIKQDLEKVEGPPAWHVKPLEKRAGGIVLIPARKLDGHIEEISKLAEECRKRMKKRHPAACKEGLVEIQKLIGRLRCDASWMLVHAGEIEIKYFFEIDRLERTLARISALARLCDQSMKGVKETTAETEKPGKYQQLAALKRQAREVRQRLEQIKARIAEIENEE